MQDLHARYRKYLARNRQMTIGAVMAFVSLSTVRASQDMDDKQAARQVNSLMAERKIGMDDSIADNDKIEATVSKLEFDSDTDGQGFTSSATLSRAERAQLAREVAPFRKFRADVRALPLLLTA